MKHDSTTISTQVYFNNNASHCASVNILMHYKPDKIHSMILGCQNADWYSLRYGSGR